MARSATVHRPCRYLPFSVLWAPRATFRRASCIGRFSSQARSRAKPDRHRAHGRARRASSKLCSQAGASVDRLVEAPVNSTDAANVRFNAWQFRQILGRVVHGVLLCQAESAAALRAFVESCRYPHQPAGVDPSLPSPASGCAAQPESQARAASGSARAGAALKPLQPRSGGCRRKNTCSAAIPGRSTRTASCCSASLRRDCDRAGQSGLVLGRYLDPDGQGLPLPGVSCRNVFYRRRNPDLSGTIPSHRIPIPQIVRLFPVEF
jgi:hypothetical protein